MSDADRPGPVPDDRAVSEVIGYVLVISLVISTVGIVSVSGISILGDARSVEQINNAERAFDLLADNLEDIYSEGAPARSTEIQLGDAQFVAEETTTLNVSWVNSATGNREVEQFGLTSLSYRGESDERLVYEGGAVYRLSRPNGSGVTLRELPFVTNGDRVVLTVPETTVDSTTAVSGSTALIRASQGSRSVVEHGDSYEEVRLNVTSPYYRAWAAALDDRGNVDCSLDDPTQTAECELTGSARNPATFSLTRTVIDVDLTR